MRIEILDVIVDPKGSRKGFVDFKVKYSSGKYEIFRGEPFLETKGRLWISPSKVMRDGEYVLRYEREPSHLPIYKELVAVLEKYLLDEGIDRSQW